MDTETVELNIGALVRFCASASMFWEDQNEFSPDFDKEQYANDIYPENENPLAMIIGADFTGVYVRVLWGERRGWVLNTALSSL